ncbi:MAG: hypothetical protein WCF84_10870 [Anaerolineae bacterium]
MREIVTLELPEALAVRARETAVRTHRRLEEVLVEWLDQATAEPPIESLPNDQVLALCELEMDQPLQSELNELLARNREQELHEDEYPRLEELMLIYRRGLVRKAAAFQVAVARGLRPPLS